MTDPWTPPPRAQEVDESGTTIAESRGGRPSAGSYPLRQTEALVRTARNRGAGTDRSRRRCPARAADDFCVLLFSRAGELSSNPRPVGTQAAARSGERCPVQP